MRSLVRQRPFVVLGSTIALMGAVVLGYWAMFGWPSGVDAAQEQAMRTSIKSHLEERHWRGALAAEHPKQKVQWFCADQLIEISQDQEKYKVGLHTLCQEFTAVDGSLVIGSGEAGPKLATVTSPPRPVEVLRVESPPDGAGYGSWVSVNFSWAGAKKAHRMARSSQNLQNATIAMAKSSLGLPDDAPVRK
jgi:hypothetical protein